MPSPPSQPLPEPTPVRVLRVSPRNEALIELKARVHEGLIHELDPEQLLGDIGYSSQARRAVELAAEERIGEADGTISRQERLRLASEIADEVLGLGPLEPLLRDPTVTEVMVNAYDRVYFERNGIIQRADTFFRDDSHVLNIIDKILRPVSRRLDDSSPMVDARLPDGSRVNAVIPPIALDGSLLTIRKFATDPFTDKDLIAFGTFTPQVRDFLSACVRGRRNIVISGGTGSGKTTLLNVVSSFIPDDERIVTIEDAAELQLHQDHVLRLESRPANIEGRGSIPIRELVKNSLRMRPDRIVVGECRDGAALDMLQAMNTGHDGSLTTVHANTPRDSLSRLETMVLMAGVDLPIRAIREQVAGAVDMVIQQARLKDGSRRVTAISEVVGMESDVITMQDLFTFDYSAGRDEQGRFRGTLKSTGLRPKFAAELHDQGIELAPDIFIRGI
jgi:pilus assembly protein CpaF